MVGPCCPLLSCRDSPVSCAERQDHIWQCQQMQYRGRGEADARLHADARRLANILRRGRRSCWWESFPSFVSKYWDLVVFVTPDLLLFSFFIQPVLPPFQVSPSVFEVPANYHRRGGSRHTPMSNNDEELLQYAIHQSLLESHGVEGQVRGANGSPKHSSVAVTLSAWPAFKTLLTSVCVNVGGDVGRCCRGLHWHSAQEPEWQVGAQDMGSLPT